MGRGEKRQNKHTNLQERRQKESIHPPFSQASLSSPSPRANPNQIHPHFPSCGLFPTKAFQAQDTKRLQQMRNQYDVNKPRGSGSKRPGLPDTEGAETQRPRLKLEKVESTSARSGKCRRSQVSFEVCFVEICADGHRAAERGGGQCNGLSLNLLNNSRAALSATRSLLGTPEL